MADQQALDEVVRFTSDLIRIDTTNRGGGDCQERPAAEYAAEQLAGAGLEPTLLERTKGRANVVARIEGTDPSADALLLHGHLDVVPAQADDWSVHPFSGEIRDGVVWGRGAVDMKNMDAMILAVVRGWAREGVRPRRDVVIAFTADEEASAEDGSGFLADQHADLFEGCTEGVSESGAFTFHDGSGRQIYPIAAGERGTGWLKLTARGRAGHGSKVNKENAVTRLAAAITRIGEHEWPLRLTETVRAALTELAALYGIETDLRDVDGLLDKLGPAAKLVESTVRNSANPTMLDAGYKINVIPGKPWRTSTDGICRTARTSSAPPSTGSPGPTWTGSSTTVRWPSRRRWTRRRTRGCVPPSRSSRPRGMWCRTACRAARTPSSSRGSASPGTASHR